MPSRWCALCLTLTLAMLVTGHAQAAPPQSAAKADYSQESAVIEEMATKIAFDNDGNSTHEQTSRVRVQTDAGVKEWGLLKFPFQSATQTVEIDYVRVHKADGSTLITPPDNVQDLDSEITRSAPFYSDLREKHIAVKGLGKGDILEYQAHWHSTKPLIPGQFWFQYNFQREGIVLDERLEIRVPSERPVKVKGPQATQTITTEGGSHVYSWTYSRLQSAKEPGSDQKTQTESARGLFPPPDVQISSFQSWEEVGRWYWNLQKDKIEPTAAIRAKAAELTQGMTDDATKLQALYSFVSTQYRYIGIAFGIGRYQPHAADDVLTNSYGDCKDKHTLLASLLQASGITLYPALISSSFKIDPDVPSPAQFDHIIGYLPQSNKDKGAIWLDTTIEVAPFGYLVPRLREKSALVMSGDKSIRLVTTPSDSPFPDTEAFKIEGKLSADGTFDAKIEDTTRGDSEVMVRSAFRQVAQPQWKDLVQRISYGLGYSGTVSDISASTPEAIGEPFHFSYTYNRKDYPDWKSNQRFTVPGSPFFMPSVTDDAKYPLWLGSLLDGVSDSRVELPPGYEAQTPSNVDLKYDFAEYHASYSRDKGVLIAKRHLVTKLREVPVAEFDNYRKFVKDIQDDVNQYVPTTSAGATTASNTQDMPNVSAAFSPSVRAIRNLPESNSSDANQLEAKARDEMAKRDLPGAVSSLQGAVAADPKFTRAWIMLGELLLTEKQVDAGMDAFRKAMATDPQEPAIPKMLGWTLMSKSEFEDAISVWQDYMKAHPDDDDGPANLGSCFVQLKRYPEAAEAYEASLKISKNPALPQARLGSVYLLAGERDKAAMAFGKLADLDPKGSTFNDSAYEMSNADLNLPLALNYATKAVRRVEEESQKTELTDLKMEDLQRVQIVAAYWDTLGWVNERMSNLEEAEQYLRASWKLTQDGVVGGHLCHLYTRTHRTALAIQMCRMAIYRMPMTEQRDLIQFQVEMAAAQENLNNLTGKEAKSRSSVDASGEVIREREFKLPRFLQGTESAEFFVLLASDGKSKAFKVENVKFISGSDKMKLQGKQLVSIDFKVPAPSNVPTRFVRRGILGCYQYTGCSFVLLDPASVHSLN
jgi:tetratricopeptide (TPR) repeat protein